MKLIRINILRIVFFILLIQLVASPLFSQDFTNGRQFDRPLQGQGSGSSFRKADLQQLQQTGGDSGDANIMTRGMMMSEPSMSGLTYQVHVLGEVKNPGTYRITASDRVSEVLQRAGGVDEQGSQRNIEVRRTGEETKRIDLVSFQTFGNLGDNPYLLDNDVVFVPLKGATVQVSGAVKRPKDYELKREKNLADVIDLSGGVTVGAAMGSSIRVIRFVDGKKELLDVASDKADMTAFEVKNGDVIFVPNVITDKNTFDYDVPKLPGDNIFYPSYEDRVFILGGVQVPGAYPFNPYYKLSQYLSLAGGTTLMATDKMTLLQPNGKKTKLHNKSRETVVINPGDTILVGQRRIAPEGWMGLAMGVAGFGLSTTATVLALTR